MFLHPGVALHMKEQLEKYQKAAVERSRIFTYEGYVGQFLKCAGLPGRKKERG